MSARPKNLANTFVPPSSPFLRPIVICGIVMALSARREIISPGSPVYDYLLVGSTNAIQAATWIQSGLFYFLYVAHAAETAYFTTKLAKHGVSVTSSAWWKWVSLCFVGGQFCFKHFDQVVGNGKAA